MHLILNFKLFINLSQVYVPFSIKKFLLKITQNSQKHNCASACNLIKKETLTQVFSCEFYEISRNTFFTEHLWTTTSAVLHPGLLSSKKEEYISSISNNVSFILT